GPETSTLYPYTTLFRSRRQKTPNEVALTILLVGLTLVFLLVVVTLLPFSVYAVEAAGGGAVVSLTVLVALLVCLIPTTIGGLLSDRKSTRLNSSHVKIS